MQDNFIINNCAAILLAAGASTRLGNPKQLLPYKGTNLVNHAIRVIEQADLHPVIVVTGANAALIEEAIIAKHISIVTNYDWQEGIASSIRAGITTLGEKHPACDGALLMVCDQPYVTENVVLELTRVQRKTGKPIAACQYDHITGTPALFHQSIFPELLLLKGDKGAGKLLKERFTDVSIVPFAMGKFDIDTAEDYEAFTKDTL